MTAAMSRRTFAGEGLGGDCPSTAPCVAATDAAGLARSPAPEEMDAVMVLMKITVQFVVSILIRLNIMNC